MKNTSDKLGAKIPYKPTTPLTFQSCQVQFFRQDHQQPWWKRPSAAVETLRTSSYCRKKYSTPFDTESTTKIVWNGGTNVRLYLRQINNQSRWQIARDKLLIPTEKRDKSIQIQGSKIRTLIKGDWIHLQRKVMLLKYLFWIEQNIQRIPETNVQVDWTLT